MVELLQSTQPWWETQGGVIVVLGVIATTIPALITAIFVAYLNLRKGLHDLKTQAKVAEDKATAAQTKAAVTDAKLDALTTERVESKKLTQDHILSLENRVVDLNRAIDPKNKGQ